MIINRYKNLIIISLRDKDRYVKKSRKSTAKLITAAATAGNSESTQISDKGAASAQGDKVHYIDNEIYRCVTCNVLRLGLPVDEF